LTVLSLLLLIVRRWRKGNFHSRSNTKSNINNHTYSNLHDYNYSDSYTRSHSNGYSDSHPYPNISRASKDRSNISPERLDYSFLKNNP
jgi:hypothetical protein